MTALEYEYDTWISVYLYCIMPFFISIKFALRVPINMVNCYDKNKLLKIHDITQAIASNFTITNEPPNPYLHHLNITLHTPPA